MPQSVNGVSLKRSTRAAWPRQMLQPGIAAQLSSQHGSRGLQLSQLVSSATIICVPIEPTKTPRFVAPSSPICCREGDVIGWPRLYGAPPAWSLII